MFAFEYFKNTARNMAESRDKRRQLVVELRRNMRYAAKEALRNLPSIDERASSSLELEKLLQNDQHQSVLIQHLLPFINELSTTENLQKISSIVAGLCEKPIPMESVQEVFSAMKILLLQTDESILSDALLAVSHLANQPHYQAHLVSGSGILPMLVQLLGHKKEEVQKATLHSIGSIMKRSKELRQEILDHQVLVYLYNILRNSSDETRKSALWVLSEITDGRKFQVEAVVQAGILSEICKLLSSGDFQVQKEATDALGNMTINCTTNQIYELIRQNVIPPLLQLLWCDDSNLVILILNFFETLSTLGAKEVVAERIIQCQGLDQIKALQQFHKNKLVTCLASEIIDQLFPEVTKMQID